ncbi:hypothetical protein [Streptomyces sp. NPDC008121]
MNLALSIGGLAQRIDGCFAARGGRRSGERGPERPASVKDL